MNSNDHLGENDHRRLGKELDLFVFSELVGAGLPLFTPRGTIIRDELIKLSEDLQKAGGFQRVFIPHITKTDLYKVSGHWDKFGEELFLVQSQETSDQMVLKPMNCPHHIQIYASQPRSYRELPIRYMESTVQYRDEKKGELNGLARVRSISIDDAHVFCRLDQLDQEFGAIMGMIKDMYGILDMEFRARLSFRDASDKYLGDPKNWETAQKTLEEVAKRLEMKYEIAEGDAAFYGPKIDIMVTDSLGREWQCATEQLDFVQPERFKLTYTDSDGGEKPVVMIHKALLGSVERFMSVYLEHTGGRLPVWLAPEQIRIVAVNQETAITDLAYKLKQAADELDLRLTVDDSSESVGKKIRDAELMKIPYILVIGEKEVNGSRVTPRIRQDLSVIAAHPEMGPEEFLKSVANEAKTRVAKSSL